MPSPDPTNPLGAWHRPWSSIPEDLRSVVESSGFPADNVDVAAGVAFTEGGPLDGAVWPVITLAFRNSAAPDHPLEVAFTGPVEVLKGFARMVAQAADAAALEHRRHTRGR